MDWRHRVRIPLLVAALVCVYPWIRGFAVEVRGRAIPPVADDHLRVVSWNIRNFPSGHDLPRLRDRLDELDPQVIAFQEVRSPTAIAEILPGWRWHASHRGGRHGQHLVIAWDPRAVDVRSPQDHPELSMDGLVRPGFSAVVHGGDGELFGLLVVHLKATRSGHEIRRTQWEHLVDIATGPLGHTPNNLLVVGDFNVAGGPEQTSLGEHHDLTAALARASLSPWHSVGGCTAYWDGVRRDAWQEPSQLDLVWSRGFSTIAAEQRRAIPGAQCAIHECGPIRATRHYPDPDLHGVSDHCPIVVDLPWSRERERERRRG